MRRGKVLRCPVCGAVVRVVEDDVFGACEHLLKVEPDPSGYIAFYAGRRYDFVGAREGGRA
ncbi:MAG: hypothetical protein QXO86_05795 [Nitrososphaerota archaeon]